MDIMWNILETQKFGFRTFFLKILNENSWVFVLHIMKLLAFDQKAIVINYQQDPACKNI